MNNRILDPMDFIPAIGRNMHQNNMLNRQQTSIMSKFFKHFIYIIYAALITFAILLVGVIKNNPDILFKHLNLCPCQKQTIPFNMPPNAYTPPSTPAPPPPKNIRFQDEIELNTHRSPSDDMDRVLLEMKKVHEKVDSLTNIKKNLDDVLSTSSRCSDDIIDRKIESAIKIYDADKIGVYDFAAQYAGGEIIDLLDTTPFHTNRSISLFNLLEWKLLSNPDVILDTHKNPTRCFAFSGRRARIRIKLGRPIVIRAVTVEHPELAMQQDPTTAPKTIKVYGLSSASDNVGTLLGKFRFNIDGASYQSFSIDNEVEYGFVELQIINNYGNPEYTCLYRFRVHDKLPPTVISGKPSVLYRGASYFED